MGNSLGSPRVMNEIDELPSSVVSGVDKSSHGMFRRRYKEWSAMHRRMGSQAWYLFLLNYRHCYIWHPGSGDSPTICMAQGSRSMVDGTHGPRLELFRSAGWAFPAEVRKSYVVRPSAW